MRSNLLLTGPPGVDKTSLLVRALDGLPSETACGFITRKMRHDRRRMGFVVETLLHVTQQNRDQLVGQVAGWMRKVIAGV